MKAAMNPIALPTALKPTKFSATQKLFTLLLLLLVFPFFLISCGSPKEDDPSKDTKAWINEPAKSSYTAGEVIEFKGSGIDYYMEFGSDEWRTYIITGSDLVWESSVDGTLGVGKEFQRDDLTPGEHKITLTAIGLNGGKDRAAVNIKIIEEKAE